MASSVPGEPGATPCQDRGRSLLEPASEGGRRRRLGRSALEFTQAGRVSSPLVGEDKGGGSRQSESRRPFSNATSHPLRDPPPQPAPARGGGCANDAIDSTKKQRALGRSASRSAIVFRPLHRPLDGPPPPPLRGMGGLPTSTAGMANPPSRSGRPRVSAVVEAAIALNPRSRAGPQPIGHSPRR
jgi:hypothetical protein